MAGHRCNAGLAFNEKADFSAAEVGLFPAPTDVLDVIPGASYTDATVVALVLK